MKPRKKANMAKSNLKLFAFLIMTAVLLIPYLVFWVIPPVRDRISQIWFGASLGLCGLNVKVEGEVTKGHPVLYACNHASYLDIPVIGGLIDGVFVAKQDVASWPLFGFLAKLYRTVFINRATMQAMNQRHAMCARLRHHNLIVFPEGTSSNGASVLPFKSTLFSVARHGPFSDPVVVQPVSIAYTRDADGDLLMGEDRDDYTWHGDMTLLPHLRRVFGLDGAEVRIIFHKPVLATDFETRKDLAKHCYHQVASGVHQALHETPETSGVPEDNAVGATVAA